MTATPDTLPLPIFIRGKVRDVYDLGDLLLMVASDRLSAFDHVLPTLVPDKGKLLTQISAFWFEQLWDVVPNHVVASKVEDFPVTLRPFSAAIQGRSMLVRKTQKLPVECVVREYLAGSGWKEYQQTGEVCGVRLPPGLRESDRLLEPIFTPATKEEGGKHDENISFKRFAEIVGADTAEALKDRSIALFIKASRIADRRGLILCDTKFEFGILNGHPADALMEDGHASRDIGSRGHLTLIDEILTPDSSRYWEKSLWVPGRSQDSFDKQFVRDYLETIRWNKQAPAPALPEEIVQKTRAKYIEAYERLTGKTF
jgi:phosphoribosylaminoimidazole-succinocarboxamide synthase